jgi:hypothetical protein
MALPGYVRRGGLDVAPPPWKCDQIRASIFYLLADEASLQEVCDRTLNRPSGAHPTQPGRARLNYKPLVNWVALTFQGFTGMRSVAPGDPGSALREAHTYSEASFWIMVEDSNGLEVLIPYMFIDDGIAQAAGREIYGFPKEHAAVTIPPEEDPLQSRFAVEALAVRDSGDPTAARSLILECVPGGDHAAAFRPAGMQSGPDIQRLIAADGVLEKMGKLIMALASGRLDLVFLRQFRALGGGAGADLQQVVAASADPFALGFPHNILLGYELRLAQIASHPIARDLGLPIGRPVDVPIGFQCNIGFTLQPGRVL